MTPAAFCAAAASDGQCRNSSPTWDNASSADYRLARLLTTSFSAVWVAENRATLV
jgi:hypothetical protein